MIRTKELMRKRRAQVVAAYRYCGNMEAVAREFDIDVTVVRKIIVAKEDKIGQDILQPNTPDRAARQRPLLRSATWRCVECGVERCVCIYVARSLPIWCAACMCTRLRRTPMLHLIDVAVEHVGCGGSWAELAETAGYTDGTTREFFGEIYRLLQRERDRKAIDALWPDGVPKYLINLWGDPVRRVGLEQRL